MFRLWGRQFHNNHLEKDYVYENADYSMTRTKKVFAGLEAICAEFDLGVPIWLDATIKDFKLHSKCRFTQDNFVEGIDFDYLEIYIIEED